MWVVRAVQMSDLDSLHELVQSATRGLTSLQLSRERLLHRVEESTFAFTRSSPSPRGEPYVLVLVDDDHPQVVGTSTIYAKTGGYQPFYAYRIVETDHASQMLGIRHHRVRLDLHRIHDGPTEIGSLFLRGLYRGQGRGRWLSLSRFALISMLPHRFADRVIAEMRGKALEDGTVPFWEAVTSRFVPCDFATADAMSTVSKQFIEEMMPEFPIYLDLLPDSVRKGIGQVHKETVPALGLLRNEGFAETDMVDIFDAGPVVCCQTDRIDAVRRCNPRNVRRIIDSVPERSERWILATTADGFTSVFAEASVEGDEITLSAAAARRLQVDVGSNCYALSPKPR